MNEQSSQLLSGAMELPLSEREELAASLWDSLEIEAKLPTTSDSEFAAITERRRSEILSGKTKTMSHEELKSQLGR